MTNSLKIIKKDRVLLLASALIAVSVFSVIYANYARGEGVSLAVSVQTRVKSEK